MRLGLIATAGIALSSVSLAQLPPPPPGEEMAQVAFFTALPDRFPAANTTAFEKLIADRVMVFRDGVLVQQTRAGWIKELQSYKPNTPTDPIGFSVSRDQYARTADGGISVREFSVPIAPDGLGIAYHPSYPLRYVTYRFASSKLVRVDYGSPMSDYTSLCNQVERHICKGIN